MKKLMVLLLVAGFAYGQVSDVRPVISTTTISTVFQTVGKDTISTIVSNGFTNVRAGQVVFGPGVKIGTTVVSTDSLRKVTLSDTCTATQDSVPIQFGYFTSAAYESGDWLGFPFKVLTGSGAGGQPIKLVSATITDAADVVTATDIVFYADLSTLAGGSGLDGVAAAELAANEWYVHGLVSLTTVTDLGAIKILTKDDINLALPKGATIWARLIARGTPTFTAVTNVRVRLKFQ